jgi:hypothetical protein
VTGVACVRDARNVAQRKIEAQRRAIQGKQWAGGSAKEPRVQDELD